MKNQAEWEELIARLMPVCHALDEALAAKPEKDVIATIARALFQKGCDTLRAINVLYRESLPMQAQALIRVLLEVRMDFEIFLQRASENPTEAARHVIDAMMLEKIRQQRQTDFRGHELVEGAPPPETLLALEKDLVARYGNGAAKAMRRYGLSGLSVEDRANQLGLSDVYNVVYRNFSRNVHGTDYMEHFRAQGMKAMDQWGEYENLRDHVALSTAITCGWQMASLANGMFGCGLEGKLQRILQACSDFEHWVPVPTRHSDD